MIPEMILFLSHYSLCVTNVRLALNLFQLTGKEGGKGNDISDNRDLRHSH